MNKNIFKSVQPRIDGTCEGGGLDYVPCGNNQYVCSSGGYQSKITACNHHNPNDAFKSCGLSNGVPGECATNISTDWVKDINKRNKFIKLLKTKKIMFKDNRVLLEEIIKKNKQDIIFNCIIDKCNNMSIEDYEKMIFGDTSTSIINTCIANEENQDDDQNQDDKKDDDDQNQDDPKKDDEDTRLTVIGQKLKDLKSSNNRYYLKIISTCEDVDILTSIEKNITDTEYETIKHGDETSFKNITNNLLEMCIKNNTNVDPTGGGSQEETIDPSYKKNNTLSIIFIIVGVIIFLILCFLLIRKHNIRNNGVN